MPFFGRLDFCWWEFKRSSRFAVTRKPRLHQELGFGRRPLPSPYCSERFIWGTRGKGGREGFRWCCLGFLRASPFDAPAIYGLPLVFTPLLIMLRHSSTQLRIADCWRKDIC